MSPSKKIISSFLMKEVINYIDRNPLENIQKALNWADRVAVKKDHKDAINTFREITSDPDNSMNKLVTRVLTELSPICRKKFLVNYFVNSGLIGQAVSDELKKKNDCNIPWAILMDPTAACNLRCTGCWAAEYDKGDSLTYEILDKIINEGKELGIYMYIYSGGEPLVRKSDIIRLAEEHDDCMFLAFTNATLVDEKFAEDLERVGNFMLAISVEGFENETDMRRGTGTYSKVIEAMDILKKHGIGFGFSTCYHNKNVEVVGSDEYVDYLIEKGCMFGWYFTYMPLGKDAVLELLASPEQREFMYHRVRDMRKEKSIFLMDFWNDGEYVNGCIAGGKNYLHINSNGDVEPCAFIHYSNVNIKEVSLLEALKSPLFMQYKEHQPFNENHLRPCPLLDNPEKLKEMVLKANAHSTQPMDKEDVIELTEKCQDISKKWAVAADKLWENSKEK